MAAAGGGKRTWVVDVEKTLKEADKSEEVSRWQRHCIYRVPACIKDLNSKAYQPQVVSLGPFHHGDPSLLPMEEHKRRALRHLLRRARRPLDEFVVAVEDAVEQLESAYLDLGGEWRGGAEARKRFLEMMIVDGCFLIEVMRRDAGMHVDDYAPNDPIFSPHGILYNVPYIRRDMLMLENQLPLLVLERIVAVESAQPPNDDFINRMVLRFLSPSSRVPPAGVGLGLHPLDTFHRSMLFGPYSRFPARPPRTRRTPFANIIRPAVELYEAGIRFKKSKTDSLCDIRFRRGVLTIPTVSVDDSTEYMFLNMMAFERLHVGAGNDVTAYVFFMNNIIDSAKDMALLSSKGIIQNAVGNDKEAVVAKLFNSISKDVLAPESALYEVYRKVNAYYWRQPSSVRTVRAALTDLIQTYFRSPWAFLSLAAAVFLLAMTVVQTVYTVLSFYKPDCNSSPSAPAPM